MTAEIIRHSAKHIGDGVDYYFNGDGYYFAKNTANSDWRRAMMKIGIKVVLVMFGVNPFTRFKNFQTIKCLAIFIFTASVVLIMVYVTQNGLYDIELFRNHQQNNND